MSYDESETKDAKEKSGQLAVVEDITMDADIWKHIPTELQTRILECCSVPDLCRFRVVSHAWNDLIRDPSFALKARPKDKYIFKAPDKVSLGFGKTDAEIQNLLRNCWEIYDPSRQKFWSISIEFLYDAVRPHPRVQGRFASRNASEVCQIVAADKGFVCVLWSSGRLDCTIMQVVNPVTRSVIRIPSFHANNTYMYKAGVMTVADDYSSFTLYIVYVTSVLEDFDWHLVRFDSQVGEWREISLPGTLTPFQMLHMNEMLYTCFEDERKYQLFALNKAGDEWMNTGVELPMMAWVVSRLATTLGRLFFVGFNQTPMVVISEIDIMSCELMLVTKMDKRNNNIKFLELLDCTVEGRPFRSIEVSKAVLGYENYIVLTSSIGGSIAYDLVKKVWSDWSWNGRTVNVIKDMRSAVFAVAMTLTLNPLPIPHVQQ